MAFESVEDAKRRTNITAGAKRRNPVGNLDNKNFDRDQMREEVENYPDEMVVNWSDLARKYNIENTQGQIAKNGGQIAKEWLKSVGVDVNRFKRRHDGVDERVRRKKLSGQGGEIAVATPQTVASIKADIKKKILSGEYTVGQQIVPRKYVKMVLSDSGEVMKTEFMVDGRKQPLVEIRERMLLSQEKYMKQRDDDEYEKMTRNSLTTLLKAINEYVEGENEEKMRAKLKNLERTRHLKMWHDLSTIANHGHLVFMVSCLYDPAVHYTNEEYQNITGEHVDIQMKVQTPEVYIVARSGSTDVEQLAYIDTRLECLQDMSVQLQTKSGTEMNDTMRFFHGDSPARQLEAGQQKGGNFYCSGCGANAQQAYYLDICFSCHYLSLYDRQQLVLAGPVGRKKSLAKNPKPFQNLKKQELVKELNSRGIYDGERKNELEKLLAQELHGVQRVPALLFTNPTSNLQSINCENYEILSFEPLHDIGKHIENVVTELPSHLPEREATAVKDVISCTVGGKETKRTFDYRCLLMILANQSLKIISSTKIQQLLTTLVEIQRIAYSSEAERSPKSVLRLHNMTWYHGILCREVFGFKLKEMTTRKLYGNYYHNITCHAAVQHRLICGKACNVEEQERICNTITNITKSTSSYHPSHIIGNIFIRLQAEKQMQAFQGSCISKQEASVSKLATSLPPYGNTIIPLQIMEKHTRSWQAHLERISDFLLPGKGSWWIECENGSVEFLDGENASNTCPQGPVLHHFRSSNFTAEEKYLVDCWKQCLANGVTLPIKAIRVEDEHGQMSIVTTTNYHYSNNNGNEEQSENVDEEQHNMDEQDPDTDNQAEPKLVGFLPDSNAAFDVQPSELEDDNTTKAVPKSAEVNSEQHGHTEVLTELSCLEVHQAQATPSHPTAAKKNHHSTNSQADNSRSVVCVTKLGKAVELVLGQTNEVIQFDKARQKHKNYPSDRCYYDDFMRKLAVMETQISKQQRLIRAELSKWEREFFLHNNCTVATQSDIAASAHAKLLTVKLKYAKAILNKFKE